jgi:hypothetical protein
VLVENHGLLSGTDSVKSSIKQCERNNIRNYLGMVSTRTKIHHHNHLSLLGKQQGGNEDFQGTKKLI